MSWAEGRILAAVLCVALLAGCGPRAEVRVLEVAPEAEIAAERAVSDSDRAAYVLNPSSRRFHRPGCAWAEKIAEDRRIDWSGGRDTLIEVGYQPCHYCEP